MISVKQRDSVCRLAVPPLQKGNENVPQNRRTPEQAKKGGKDDDDSGGAKSIIDRFLDENPSIKRKVQSDNKQDLSEESTHFSKELASETLAQIYADQGNKKRAIKIYETLSLKFPEKKSYFAALIKKLRD